MRKTAGFLLVLLLAILAIITTTSGDETDNSHLAHLTAPYGPLIASCDVCHVVPYAGVFTDGQDLANTTVCDPCHSPGGAYDGVNGPYIGAKSNWVSGVFDGSALQHSKEKWCVGCHDDGDSSINEGSMIDGVSAPNIAGDNVNYGYYKTGHGRGYGSDQPAVSCLECHDPALTHVDGAARTYTAVADNYQDGYRLKSVNGFEPLEVPRSGSAFTVDQFRLCFSCHESAPFLNSSDTDTNFRSDVNDSCVDLNPPTNRHRYHLQAMTFFRNKWDSDWDGATADSTASCTACHNVHGPRNAPAMIRTGELIGREYSLNLEYYVNPCPDTTLLLTTETLDSTGGQNKFIGGGSGSVLKNGVCNMCHNEVEPYWRTPTEITSSYTTQVDEYKDCTTCHESGLPPTVCGGASDPDNPAVDCEFCHGHDEGYEYAQGETGPLYSWGIGSLSGTLTSPSHSTHTENDGDDLRGLTLACDACHNMNSYNDFYSGGEVLFSDGQNLANTTVCDSCHSPGGVYNGVNDPVIGAKTDWDDGVYDGSSLKSGKEKWCVGCHDDGDSSIDEGSKIDGVIAPNMAGDDVDYGFYKTGHGKHNNEEAISCLTCHDTTFIHVDGKARTYAADDNNYQAGYRLKSVNGLAPMVVPRKWDRWTPSDIDAGQFRLCFSCHDSAPFLNSNNTDTNFRSDVNDSCETLDPPANRHWYHLQPIGNFNQTWDSDLDGANDPERGPGKNTADSMPSCPACHNVHGPKLKGGATHAPAMIRTGELIGRSSSLNLDYFTSECPDKTHSDTNELFDATGNSTGGEMISQGGRQGSVEKNGVCQMCHMETEPYWREAKDIVGCGSGICHINPSHATHLTANYGPQISCSDCHNTDEDNFSRFSDGENLVNTQVCDPCHSPGGTYNGVDHLDYGAKDNWDDGVYDGSALKAGKEKWCATCHDEEPSVIDGVTAPNIVGDEDGEYIYGTGWGYYKTGHGLTASAAYPSKGGLIEPPLINGAARPVECDSCHDFSTAHIDGLARTYDDGDSSNIDPSYYRIGYRLDLVPLGEGSGTSTQEPLLVPWPGGGTPNVAENAPLCYKCHDPDPFIENDNPNTNLETNADPNLHEYHLTFGNNQIYMADWSGTKNSQITCVVCHNVHGSTWLAMVRDGKLVSQTPGVYDYDGGGDGPEPGLQIWYKNDAISTYETNNTDPPSPEDLPLAASDGTVWIGHSSANLCTHCHDNQYTVGEDRTPFQVTSQAPTLDWTGESAFKFDGANPDSGVSGGSFTFRVKYTDQNNYGPVSPSGYINLLIDIDCDTIADLDSPYAMTGTDVGDVNYMNGRIYTKDLVLTGTENSSICYKFEARNETGLDATGSPTDWNTILLLNNVPILSWTGEEYYENDGVNPDTGGDDASFTFRVTYTDADNECPPGAGDMQVWIDADDSTGNYGNGEKHDMTAVDSGDSDCSDGKLYTYTTDLSYKGDGILNYRFYATDGTDGATGDPAADSTVTVLKNDTNTPPFLTWYDGTCVTEGVKPSYGAAGADFDFYVKYADPDGCPAAADAVQVTIEGVGTYDMTGDGGDTDCTDGRVYSVSKNDLTAGTYNYYFSATDNGGASGYGDPTITATYEVEVVDAYKVRPAGGTGWYTTIQAGAYAAAQDSTIKTALVYDGTYDENLTIDNSGLNYSNVTVRSVCGPDVTIIEPSGGGNVVVLQNVSGVTIDGFSITGGTIGVNSNSGSATINNCKIHDNNNSTGRGGGFYAGTASGILTVVDSEIYSNTSLGGSAAAFNAGYGHSFTNTNIHDNEALYDPLYAWSGSAGAVYTQTGSLTFTDVTIVDNTSHGNGGAVYSNGSDVTFIRSTITGNTSTAGSGGAIALGNGGENAYLENCIVADNQANSGGVAWLNGAEFISVNSTFAGNQATAGDGGILWQQNATSEFRNSILWNNTASDEGHIAWFNGGSMTITDTVIASGNDGIPTNAPYFAGNVTPSVSGYVSENDPFFVDAENGDYHLKNFSPAIDHGTAEDPPLSVDIDGDTRPFDCIGLGDGVDDYDIGADEVAEEDQPTIDSLSTTNPTAVESGAIDAGGSIVMSRFQVDCDDTGDSQCILESVTVEDIATGLSGDWDSLEIYIDTDTDITGATLVGQEDSWDGSAETVLLNLGTQADRTVTNGTPKYVFIVYDITEAAEGAILKSRVTQVDVKFPDIGVTDLSYESNIVTVNGDALSTSNNTAIQATDPGAGEANIVMQRFEAECGATGNNVCILSDITVKDTGTATTGDWDSLKIYIDTDTDFAGSTLIGQTTFDGTTKAVPLDQGTVADRTVTNGTSKYIFIVYDINSGAEGKTIRNRVTGVGVESPDDGESGLVYYSNLLTVQEAVGGDNLSTSNPTAVHNIYADQGEDAAVMERFQVDCDTADDGNCILSSVTVDDLGTASTGDWDNLNIYIDTDITFAGATLIGQTSSWDGTSTIVSLSLGTEGDRTVTNGTSKYVFVVYDLSASIAVDTTLQSRVTAVGVSFPDTGVTGITYDSDVVTVKDAIYVGSGGYTTIQAAVNAASNGDTIIVSEGTYVENVNHSPPSSTKVLHIYSANGPENTIIDGNDSGSVVTLGYRSSTSTLSGFTITNGSVTGIGGAGIYINMAQPTIDNCIITGNDAPTLPGGGIHVNNAASDVTITNTIISNNTGGNGGGLYLPSGTNATISNVVFDQNTGDLGGAIYFNGTDSTTTITDSTFSDNHSTTQGGAFFIQGVNGIKFSRCTITGNHADDMSVGGGVLRTGSSTSNTTFENCIIAGNYAPVAGVFSLNGGAMTLINSTVADNYATATWNGGGIAYICSGTVNMTNSIAWGNSAASGYGHNVYRTCTGPSGANVGTISYSDFDSTYGTFMYQALITDGGGNIDPATDPSFDAGGTYHLTSSSTNVIDAGTSSGAPSDDIDGHLRPLGSGYDMGADEYAVVYTVTKTADTNDGTCDADCSLREAVGAANGDGADSLIIIPAGTYPLTRTGTGEDSNSTGDLDINTGDIAILGAGSGSTIIDGGAIDRVFHQPWWQGITFIVKDVKITNGDPGADAGGCLNVTNSPLYIIDSIIDSCGNSVDATDGGAVYINGGALTVTGSTFSNNDTSTMGGAIMMYNESLSIDNSTFSNNSSGGGGGAVRSSNSTGIITSSTFSGNAAGASAQGGAINHSGTGSVEITDSTFSGNTAQHGGGVKADSVTLNRSTFTGNTASGVGGALVTWDGTNIYIYNSTVSGNTANGGGAFYTQGNSTIKSSTIANNTASWSGGVHINDAGDTCTVQNTIFNNNGSTCGGSGSITSLGNNIDDNSSCGFTQTGDQQGTDALLEALADNGGPTQTHALQTSPTLSPAIDAGDNTACAASPINNVDQRGETRPADGDGDLTATCDAGAYEYIP